MSVEDDNIIKKSAEREFARLRIRTIEQQKAKKETYEALSAKRLPIPQDLRLEIEAHGEV